MISHIVPLLSLLAGILAWILTGLWWLLPLCAAACFAALGFLYFLFLCIVCRKVDMNVPQEKDDPFFRRLLIETADAIVFVLAMRLHTRGLDRIPKDGRFLLVCNHISDFDPVVLTKCFPKSQISFISKRENQSMLIVGPVMHRTMCQLINRENDREALKTILKCIQLLKEDQVSIGVFPEGYTSMSGHLQKLRSGSLKIAVKAKVPIVVCTIQGTNRVVKNITRLRPTPVQLHLLEVIPPEAFTGRTAVDLGEQIYQMMAADLSADYAPLEAKNP